MGICFSKPKAKERNRSIFGPNVLDDTASINGDSPRNSPRANAGSGSPISANFRLLPPPRINVQAAQEKQSSSCFGFGKRNR